MELTLSIFNNLSIVSFHDCDAGIGGSQINTNDAIHKTNETNKIGTYDEKFLEVWRTDLVFYFFKSVLNIICFLI